MSKHLPEAPPANQSHKGPGDAHEPASDTTPPKRADPGNGAERGATANIKQNTVNEGFFRGRRMK